MPLTPDRFITSGNILNIQRVIDDLSAGRAAFVLCDDACFAFAQSVCKAVPLPRKKYGSLQLSYWDQAFSEIDFLAFICCYFI